MNYLRIDRLTTELQETGQCDVTGLSVSQIMEVCENLGVRPEYTTIATDGLLAKLYT